MENADTLIGRELLDGMANPPKWAYRFGFNRLIYTTKLLIPINETKKFVQEHLFGKRNSFRIGLAFRYINIVLLVIEPLLAAGIITAFNGSDLQKIILFAVLMALLDAACSLVSYIASRNLTKAYTLMRDEIQTDLTKNVLEIKTEHIDSHSSGVFIQRIMEETTNLASGIDEMLNVITEGFRLVALLFAFFLVSRTMFLFEIALFVLYFLIVLAQERKLNNDNRILRRSKENLGGIVTEMVKAARDIKLLHCEDSFTVKAADYISDHTRKAQDVENHSNNYIFGRRQFVAWTNLLYIAVLVILMWKYGMSPATALVLYTYNGRAYASARAVSTAAQSMYALSLSAERVFQLLNSKDFAQAEWGEEKLKTIKGSIDLNDVFFSYKDENGPLPPVLKGVNLHIRPGESVALVGKSGCGKSTILSLITRLYEPTQGSILLDGIDMALLDKDSIRSNIGMVSQMPYIFNMSIRENFAIIKKDVTEEEIISACRTACIHDDIMKFPAGYDTVAGEGGVMLSGGQRQRIALARCLIRDYPIIMLDEATSALDNVAQEKISRAIGRMRDRTVIMVAHRLSTVINCDRLFFIEDVKVLAEGTHSELLKCCDAYRTLYGEEAAAV